MIFKLVGNFSGFRHSYTKNHVSWLLTLSSDKFATFGISSHSDYFRRAYGIAAKGMGACRKTWKTTNIIIEIVNEAITYISIFYICISV